MSQNLKRWVIVAINNDLDDHGRESDTVLYWSNVDGWTPDLSLAFLVYDDEKEVCSLPMGGTWLDITKETE